MQIAYEDFVNSSVVTASSQQYEGDADKVKNDVITDRWESGTTTANEWLQFTTGSVQTVRAVGLFGFRNFSGVTVFLQADATSSSWGAPSYNVNLGLDAIGQDEGLIDLISAESYLFWRLLFVKSAGDQIGVGRVFLSDAITLDRDIDVQWAPGSADTEISVLSSTKQKFTEAGKLQRVLTGTISNNDDAARLALHTWWRAVGSNTPSIASPGHTDYAHADIFGYLDSQFLTPHLFRGADGNHRWGLSFNITQAI
jgi:hypothetical protein